LPIVWQRCWNVHPGQPPEPAELLAAMHDLLADCLPDGIFLEGILVRLGSDGRATVSPAGGIRLLVRNGQRQPDLVKLRGAWLGVRAPRRDEQHTLRLGHGDELLLATDGLFDQLDDQGGPEALTRGLSAEQGVLFGQLRERLEQSLTLGEQKDDITMVLLRRRLREREVDPVTLPFSGVTQVNGQRNV
jgi:serine phosphatase RsbU (regulator of sigma subunit)